MLDRLNDNYQSGANAFNRSGEALFGLERMGQLVGVVGLNIDPYFNDSDIGRVRHLYVHPAFRRSGVGRVITEAIEAHATGRFTRLQLFTSADAAARFYEALGYSVVSGVEKVSHAKELGPQ